MNPDEPTKAELFDYVTGRLAQHRAEEIKHREKIDPEIAARLLVIRRLMEIEEDITEEP